MCTMVFYCSEHGTNAWHTTIVNSMILTGASVGKAKMAHVLYVKRIVLQFACLLFESKIDTLEYM